MDKIKVSLILPYYNELSSIEYTLNNLLKLNYQPNEIIFVNSNSTDKSFEDINSFIKKNKISSWHNFDTKLETPSEAKNFGISKAKYDWCCFMDFDIAFDQNFLKKQVEIYEKNPNKKIFISVIDHNPSTDLDKLIIMQTWGLGKKSPVIPGSLIKKEVFIEVGYFLPYRSYYDKVFLKRILNLNITQINWEVVISYRNICYANSFKDFIIKTINYHCQQIFIKKLIIPKIYLFLPVILLAFFYYNSNYLYSFLIIYFLLRGLLIPSQKNQNFFKKIKKLKIFKLFIIGFVYDISKFIGYNIGLVYLIFKRKIRLDKYYKK